MRELLRRPIVNLTKPDQQPIHTGDNKKINV